MFRSSRRAFYLLNSLDFTNFVNYLSWLPDGLVPAVLGRRSNPYSERKAVVHGASEVLLAAKIALSSLHGRMAQQELNLLKLAAARVT
jgi:hypothetical protein